MGRSRGHDKPTQRGKERTFATRENELDYPAEAEATIKDYFLYNDEFARSRTGREVAYEKAKWDETVDGKTTPEKRKYLAIKRFRSGKYIHGAEPGDLEPGQYTIKPNLYIGNFSGTIERLSVHVNPPTVPNPLGNRSARRGNRRASERPESHAQYSHRPPKSGKGPGDRQWTFVTFDDVEERNDFTTLPREARQVAYARMPGSNYYTVTYSWPADVVSLERLNHALHLPRLVNKLAVGHRPNGMEISTVPEGVVPTDEEHYGKLHGPVSLRNGAIEVTFYTLKTKNWRRTYHTLPTPDVINWQLLGKVAATTYTWSTSHSSRNKIMHALNGNIIGRHSRQFLMHMVEEELSNDGPRPIVSEITWGIPSEGPSAIREALSAAVSVELLTEGPHPLYNELILGVEIDDGTRPDADNLPKIWPLVTAGSLVACVWFMGHASWNALMHALNGNVVCYDCDQEGHRQGSPMCQTSGGGNRREPAMAQECNRSVQTTCQDHHHPKKRGKGDGKPKDGAARRFAMKDMQICDQAGMCVLPGCHYHDARSARVRNKPPKIETNASPDALDGWDTPGRAASPEPGDLALESGLPRPSAPAQVFATPVATAPSYQPSSDDSTSESDWADDSASETEDEMEELRNQVRDLPPLSESEDEPDETSSMDEPSPPEQSEILQANSPQTVIAVNVNGTIRNFQINDVAKLDKLRAIIFAATLEPDTAGAHQRLLKEATRILKSCGIDSSVETLLIYKTLVEENQWPAGPNGAGHNSLDEQEGYDRLEGIVYAATLEEDPAKARRRLRHDAIRIVRSCGIEPLHGAILAYQGMIDRHAWGKTPPAAPNPDEDTTKPSSALVVAKKPQKDDLEEKWDLLEGKLMMVINRAGYSPTALKTLGLQTETNLDILGIPKSAANAERAIQLAIKLFLRRQKYLMDHDTAHEVAFAEARHTELYSLDTEEGEARNLFIMNPRRWYHAAGRAVRSMYDGMTLGSPDQRPTHVYALPNIATRCCEVALNRWMADRNLDLRRLRSGDHNAFQPGFSLDLRRWELSCPNEKTYCAVGFTLGQATTWVPGKCGHNELLSIVARQLLGPVPESTPETRRTVFRLGRLLQEETIAPMPYAQPPRAECLNLYLRGKTPAQRTIILAGEANVANGNAVNTVAECFVKVEACLAKPLIKSHPRNISGCDRFGTYLYSLGPTFYAYQKAYIQFMFRRRDAIQTLLEVKFVYTGGMSRGEVGSLIALMESKGLSACEIDLSRCDGHNSAEARIEEGTHYLRNGMSEEDRDLLLRDNVFRGRTSSGIRFTAGATQASGRPDTSLGTSVRLIFISRVYGAWHAWHRATARPTPTTHAEAEAEVSWFTTAMEDYAVFNDVVEAVEREPTYALQLGDDNVLATPGDACGVMVTAFYRWAGHDAVVTVRGSSQAAWDLTSYCSSYAYRIGDGRRHLDNKIFRTLAKTFVCSNISLTEADMPAYVTGIAKGLTSTWLPVLGDVTKQILSKNLESITSSHDRKLDQHKHIQEEVSDVDQSEVADHFQTIYGVAPSYFDFVKDIDWTITGRCYTDPRFGPALEAEGSIPKESGDPEQQPESIARTAPRPRRIRPQEANPAPTAPTPVLDDMLSSVHDGLSAALPFFNLAM